MNETSDVDRLLIQDELDGLDDILNGTDEGMSGCTVTEAANMLNNPTKVRTAIRAALIELRNNIVGHWPDLAARVDTMLSRHFDGVGDPS